MITETKKKLYERLPRKRAWKSAILPCVFTVRASEEEGSELKKLAAQTGWSVSRLMVEATLRNGIRPADEAQAFEAKRHENLERVIFEIHKIGISVNQISHAVNAAYRGEEQPFAQDKLDAVLKEVERMLKVVKARI